MRLPKTIFNAWEALGHFSLAQWVWSIGGSAVVGVLTWIADQPLWLVSFVCLGAFAIILIIVPRLRQVWRHIFGARLVVESLEVVENTPVPGHSAVRIVLRNRSVSDLDNLKAELTDAVPALQAAFPNPGQPFALPLTLATKTRLDAFRNNGQPLPHQRFRIGPRERKQVELLWLQSHEATEGYTTYEGGQAEYLLWFNQMLEVEISGHGAPCTARILISKPDDETHEWSARLMHKNEAPPDGNPYEPL